jgi:hypothetical protein
MEDGSSKDSSTLKTKEMGRASALKMESSGNILGLKDRDSRYNSPTLKKEAEKLLAIHQTTWHHIPENCNP